MPNEKKRYLFVIDLDGTVLADSRRGIIPQENIDAVKRATSEGHVVCIATGRPWRSTRKIYEALELKTIVANYNGAHVHNPSDYNFNPVVSYMHLNDVLYILGDHEIKKNVANIAIEGPGWVMVEKADPILAEVFGFNDASKYRVGIDYHKLPLRPTGVILDTKEGVNVTKFKDYLQRMYGDLVEFSSWSKGEGETPVFDMTTLGITKGKVLPMLMRYYDIPMRRTVAIGDSYNDLTMFEMAEISAAVANAHEDIKEKAVYVCKRTNKQGAVAEVINKVLDDLKTEDEKWIKEQRARRRELMRIRDAINSSPA